MFKQPSLDSLNRNNNNLTIDNRISSSQDIIYSSKPPSYDRFYSRYNDIHGRQEQHHQTTTSNYNLNFRSSTQPMPDNVDKIDLNDNYDAIDMNHHYHINEQQQRLPISDILELKNASLSSDCCLPTSPLPEELQPEFRLHFEKAQDNNFLPDESTIRNDVEWMISLVDDYDDNNNNNSNNNYSRPAISIDENLITNNNNDATFSNNLNRQPQIDYNASNNNFHNYHHQINRKSPSLNTTNLNHQMHSNATNNNQLQRYRSQLELIGRAKEAMISNQQQRYRQDRCCSSMSVPLEAQLSVEVLDDGSSFHQNHHHYNFPATTTTTAQREARQGNCYYWPAGGFVENSSALIERHHWQQPQQQQQQEGGEYRNNSINSAMLHHRQHLTSSLPSSPVGFGSDKLALQPQPLTSSSRKQQTFYELPQNATAASHESQQQQQQQFQSIGSQQHWQQPSSSSSSSTSHRSRRHWGHYQHQHQPQHHPNQQQVSMSDSSRQPQHQARLPIQLKDYPSSLLKRSDGKSLNRQETDEEEEEVVVEEESENDEDGLSATFVAAEARLPVSIAEQMKEQANNFVLQYGSSDNNSSNNKQRSTSATRQNSRRPNLQVRRTLRVKIKKSKPILGIAIEGGFNVSGQLLPRIVCVHEDGAAYQCGKLRASDLILAVNGISTVNMTHDEIAKTIANAYYQDSRPYIEFLIGESIHV